VPTKLHSKHIKQDFIFSQCSTHIYLKFKSDTGTQETWFIYLLLSPTSIFNFRKFYGSDTPGRR